MGNMIKEAAEKRLRGERASPVRAVVVASTVGFSAAVIAYKAMRSAE